jgi:hypothetical protein
VTALLDGPLVRWWHFTHIFLTIASFQTIVISDPVQKNSIMQLSEIITVFTLVLSTSNVHGWKIELFYVLVTKL